MRARVYSIGKVLQMRDKIQLDPKVSCFLAQTLQGETLDDFVTAVHEHLSKKVPWGIVFESLEHLAGLQLTDDMLEKVAWRLAGNQARLALQIPVGPWCRQVVDELVPVQVLCMHIGYTSRGKFGGTFDLQVLAGTLAAMVINTFWTVGYCQMLKTMLGFSRPWGDYPFEDIRQLVGLRFTVRIASELSGSSPNFEKIWQENDQIKPPSLLRWNKATMRHRRRVDFKCPRNYPVDQVVCHRCVAGLNECVVATHDETYVKRYCDSCEKDTWFDPVGPRQDLCIQCYQKNLRQQDA